MKVTWRFTVLPRLLLLLGVLQHAMADPRPDFAIKATISGTTKVVSLSTQLSLAFDKVDNMNLPLTAGYNLLGSMKDALVQIGRKITTAGMGITSALNTLAGDSSNNVNPLFLAVTNAINALKTLLQTGLSAEFTALQKQDTYITDQFSDGFGSIISMLPTLSGALDRLKAGVTAAKDAPGNTPTAVSSANVRKYVTVKMVTDVQDAITLLQTDIPLVQFIIESTQKRLVLADAFIIDMEQEASDNAALVAADFASFEADVTSIGESVAGAFADLVTPVYDAQLSTIADVRATIESITTYADDLQPALDSLALLLDANIIDSLGAAIDGAFADYNTAVDGSIASANSVENFFVDEACGALQQLVGALVASGYYANYCFTKYSNKVFNQFAMTFYLVSECYEIEIVRLHRLQDLTALIIEMIIYDIEDLGEAITSCAPLNDGAPCLTLIGPFYEILANTIDDKQSYLLNYVDEETKLSLQRLSSCVTVSKYAMVIALVPISIDLDECTISGYAP